MLSASADARCIPSVSFAVDACAASLLLCLRPPPPVWICPADLGRAQSPRANNPSDRTLMAIQRTLSTHARPCTRNRNSTKEQRAVSAGVRSSSIISPSPADSGHGRSYPPPSRIQAPRFWARACSTLEVGLVINVSRGLCQHS